METSAARAKACTWEAKKPPKKCNKSLQQELPCFRSFVFRVVLCNRSAIFFKRGEACEI
jgi:hypothetical protein